MHGVMMLQGHRIYNWRRMCVDGVVVEGCSGRMSDRRIEGLNKKRLDDDNGAKYKG